ncbi:MAG: hypothetical protein AB9834_05250 [Lentimicrobium sp.]
MKRYLTYLSIIGAIGIIVLAAFPLRNYYLFLKEPVAPLSDAIPLQTGILVKTGSLNKLIKILRSSDIFALLEKSKNSSGIKTMADKVDGISQKSSFFAEIAAQNEVVICLVPGKNLNPEMLFLTGTGKTSPRNIREEIESIFIPGQKIEKIKHKPCDLFSIKQEDQEIWFYIHKGILAIAFDRVILEQSCAALNMEENLTDDRSFQKLTETSGKRVDGVMMINNKKLIETILRIKDNNPLDYKGSPFSSWISLDLHIEKNRILMDGFTAGQHETSIFTGQEPCEISNLEMLPSGTAFAIQLSISDQQSYTAGFMNKDTLHIAGYDSANQTESSEVFRREDHLRAWIGNTISFAAMPRYFSGDESARLVLIEIKNADSAANSLKPYLRPYKDNIYILTAPDLPERLWGKLFPSGGQQFCLLTDRMLAISPSPGLLEFYSGELSKNRLLGSTRLYKDANSLLLEKSNITIFAVPAVCNRYFKMYKPGEDSSTSQKWTGLPALGDLICLQFSAGAPLMFTHAFVLFNSGKNSLTFDEPDYQKLDSLTGSEKEVKSPETTTVSEKEIANKVSGIKKIMVFPGQKSGNNLILAFNKNKIHAYSEKGEILWTFECNEEPSGGVVEIGLKKQKGRYFMFIAGKFLHIIDQNGREINDYPVKLPSAAAGNLAVFDYDRNKDYRILYQGKDNLLHNVTIVGKELSGWQPPKPDNGLSNPPQFFRTSGKDFIVYADSRGKINITDRRGRQRIKVEEGLLRSTGSQVFENKTNNKGIFLMASSKGDLAYIDINGKITESRFGDHGNHPWFDYCDFNGDKVNDFIFCGIGKIAVYTKKKDVIAAATLPGASFSKPTVYSSKRISWLAVRDVKSRKIVVFNTNQQSVKGKSLLSDTDPVIYYSDGEKMPVLITVLDGKPVFTLLE